MKNKEIITQNQLFASFVGGILTAIIFFIAFRPLLIEEAESTRQQIDSYSRLNGFSQEMLSMYFKHDPEYWNTIMQSDAYINYQCLNDSLNHNK